MHRPSALNFWSPPPALWLGRVHVAAMTADRIRIIKPEAVPLCGSFEVPFLTVGRPGFSIGMTSLDAGCGQNWLIAKPAKRDAQSFARAQNEH